MVGRGCDGGNAHTCVVGGNARGGDQIEGSIEETMGMNAARIETNEARDTHTLRNNAG